ncbi:MAG: gamma-glutamyl phosphate reductase [Actinobacteria bacterium]|nr:MAG: gamma-glutamyl phosphate reductase [Actinomycetota bacterium]
MTVTMRFPDRGERSLADLLAQLTADPDGKPLAVGDPRIRDFLAEVAGRLLAPKMARRYPELASLGFFLRRAEVDRMARRLIGEDPLVIRVPRGLVFHVPPANVDTVFVYSWALSALAGNRNVVRISSRAAGAAEAILDVLAESVAQADPVVAHTQLMITYGRDDEVTAALSAACDLRVIWGGDRSVTELRRHPLAPLARDVVFPDRSSFALLGVSGWRRASDAQRRAAVDGFANDVYWFDQAACSSPRALYLVGPPGDAEGVLDEFRGLLAEAVRRRGWTVDAAMAVEKRVRLYGAAADGHVTDLEFAGNELAWLRLADPTQPPRGWLGAGVVPVARVDSLADVAKVIQRRDQTVSYFGFALDELREFIAAVGGRGIDRVVPFGQALSFAPVWDGYDLLTEFTRATTLRG